MATFTTVTSQLIPMLAPGIDTDQVIPAQYVNARGREALAAALFANRRAAEPRFVLNDPKMQGRAIMLTGPNFGCGSSREAAAWAIAAFGIRVLLGTTFNETFASNCLQNGLLAVPLAPSDHAAVAAMLEEDRECTVTVDLERNAVDLPDGRTLGFSIDPFAREMLLSGQDEMGYLLARRDSIAAFEAAYNARG